MSSYPEPDPWFRHRCTFKNKKNKDKEPWQEQGAEKAMGGDARQSEDNALLGLPWKAVRHVPFVD